MQSVMVTYITLIDSREYVGRDVVATATGVDDISINKILQCGSEEPK